MLQAATSRRQTVAVRNDEGKSPMDKRRTMMGGAHNMFGGGRASSGLHREGPSRKSGARKLLKSGTGLTAGEKEVDLELGVLLNLINGLIEMGEVKVCSVFLDSLLASDLRSATTKLKGSDLRYYTQNLKPFSEDGRVLLSQAMTEPSFLASVRSDALRNRAEYIDSMEPEGMEHRTSLYSYGSVKTDDFHSKRKASNQGSGNRSSTASSNGLGNTRLALQRPPQNGPIDENAPMDSPTVESPTERKVRISGIGGAQDLARMTVERLSLDSTGTAFDLQGRPSSNQQSPMSNQQGPLALHREEGRSSECSPSCFVEDDPKNSHSFKQVGEDVDALPEAPPQTTPKKSAMKSASIVSVDSNLAEEPGQWSMLPMFQHDDDSDDEDDLDDCHLEGSPSNTNTRKITIQSNNDDVPVRGAKADDDDDELDEDIYNFEWEEPQEPEMKPSHRWIVHPNSSSKHGWDVISLVFIVVESFLIPLHVGFDMVVSDIWYWLTTGWFCADMVLQCFTGYWADGKLHLDQMGIIRRYIFNGFIIDACATMPWDYVLNLGGNGDEDMEGSYYAKAARFGKLLRIMRLLRLMKLSSLQSNLEELLPGSNIQTVMGFANLVGSFILLLHWAACIWGFIGNPDKVDHESQAWPPYNLSDCEPGGPCEGGVIGTPWLLRYGFTSDGQNTVSTQYLMSLSFATAIITGGDLPIFAGWWAERLYTVLMMVLSFVICSTILSKIVVWMEKFSAERTQFRENMCYVKEYMVRRGVPRPLRAKVRRYLEFQFDCRRGNGESVDFMSELSPWLRLELKEHLNQDVIKLHPIFDDMPPSALKRVCAIATSVLYAPGDMVVQRGHYASCMFFIVSGKLKVINTDVKSGRISNEYPSYMDQGILESPSWIGDQCLFREMTRSRSVVSLTHVELLMLPDDLFDIILKEFPKLQKWYCEWREKVLEGAASGNLIDAGMQCEECLGYGHSMEHCPNVLARIQKMQSADLPRERDNRNHVHSSKKGHSGHSVRSFASSIRNMIAHVSCTLSSTPVSATSGKRDRISANSPASRSSGGIKEDPPSTDECVRDCKVSDRDAPNGSFSSVAPNGEHQILDAPKTPNGSVVAPANGSVVAPAAVSPGSRALKLARGDEEGEGDVHDSVQNTGDVDKHLSPFEVANSRPINDGPNNQHGDDQGVFPPSRLARPAPAPPPQSSKPSTLPLGL